MAFELHNHMEVVVDHILPDLLAEYEVCDCPRCQMDIRALTLNELDPKYVVTQRGELMMAIDATLLQHQANVLAAAIQAIMKVKQNPRHDET